MKQKTEKMEVTPEERELLERMRNYNKSYPNGYPQLLWDLQELFDKMVRQPYVKNKRPLPYEGEAQ